MHVLLLVIDYAKCRLRMSSNDSAATGLLLLSRYHVGIGLRIQQSSSSSQQKRRFGGLFFFCAANMTRALAALCIPYTTHFNDFRKRSVKTRDHHWSSSSRRCFSTLVVTRCTTEDASLHLDVNENLRKTAEINNSPGNGNLRESVLDLTNNLQQRTAEWHSLRNGRITASAFGNALGFWKTGRIDLWEEKIGLRKPFTGNQATQWGTDQEAGAIERYRQITGNLVDSIAFKIYNEGDDLQEWLGASPDGLIDANISRAYVKGGILEVKCPHNKGSPEQGVPWSAVPYYYMPQAQGLLEIFDRDWMDFYVWCLNGSAVFRIHRDPEYWTLIFRVMSEYWWGNVVPAKHLLMDGKELETIKGLRPAASHPLTDTVVTKSRLLAAQAPLVWRDIGSQRLNAEDIKIRLQDFYSF